MPSKVVIVGAGISGLAAAKHLHQSGLYDVTILEAANQIGGRIRTIDFHGELIELGAQWLHGTKGNQIYKFAKENEIKLITSKEESEVYAPVKTGSVVSANGKEISEEEMKLFLEVDDVLDDLEERALELLEEDEDRIHDFKSIDNRSLAKELWKKKLEQSGNVSKISNSMTEAIFEYIMTVSNLIDGCCPEDTSLLQYYLYEELEGPHMTFAEGYSTVPRALAQSLPKSCIQLGCKAVTINWKESRNASPVLVQYSNQEEEKVFLEADHVIAAVSLGCLKKYHKDLFIPNLPVAKQTSIEKFGFGSINKIFFYYKDPFWRENELPLYILWDKEVDLTPGREWCRLLEAVEVCNSHILMCWVTAEIEKAIAGKTEEEIGLDVTDLLRKYKNNNGIPEPDDILYTNWGKDDNFLGSYSYCALGSSSEDIKNLAAPLEVDGVPRVLFCGEATHGSRFSSADGAFGSGLREAQRLIDRIQAKH